MLPPFTLERPTTITDALSLIDEDRVGYWGGTELLLAMSAGMLAPDSLVDLKRIPELRGIRTGDDNIVVAAGTTHDELATSSLIASTLPLLADVETRIGNARVRAQGSIGGNLCFAEPRSDVATLLIALDATVTLRSRAITRTMPIHDFVLGPYWTARQPDELLTEVTIPTPSPSGAYRKLQVSERPTVGVAAVRTSSGGCRIVVGAIGEMPRAFDYRSWEDIDPIAIADELEPIPDLTGSVEYKRNVAAVYIRRAVEAAQQEEDLDE